MPEEQEPMAGASPLPRTPDGKIPGWLRRALNKSTPTTKDQETMRTASSELDGKEILYPTIRMLGGKLRKLDDEKAFAMARQRKDYIVVDSPAEAVALSKRLSALVGRVRGMK